MFDVEHRRPFVVKMLRFLPALSFIFQKQKTFLQSKMFKFLSGLYFMFNQENFQCQSVEPRIRMVLYFKTQECFVEKMLRFLPVLCFIFQTEYFLKVNMFRSDFFCRQNVEVPTRLVLYTKRKNVLQLIVEFLPGLCFIFKTQVEEVAIPSQIMLYTSLFCNQSIEIPTGINLYL